MDPQWFIMFPYFPCQTMGIEHGVSKMSAPDFPSPGSQQSDSDTESEEEIKPTQKVFQARLGHWNHPQQKV